MQIEDSKSPISFKRIKTAEEPAFEEIAAAESILATFPAT